MIIICKGVDMEIKDVKKLTDCSFLNLFSVQYKDQGNRDKEWVFASRSKKENPLMDKDLRPDAVVIVPFHTKLKKLVLINELRVALGGYQYGFPAGLLDKGETVEQAGTRELFEETGLKITRFLKQSPPIFSSSGLTDEAISLLFVECDGIPTNKYNEASEDIEVMLLSREDVSDILFDQNIKFDVKTWIVLNHFVSQGKI